jgi:hypothetical protein
MDKPAQLKALAKVMKPNHLKMAKALSEGKSQADAYRKSGGKGVDAYKCACGLIKTNPEISRYSELSKEIQAESAQKKGIATFEDKAALLWHIAQHNSGIAQNDTDAGDSEEIKMVDPKAAISAMAELNKMSGDLATVKSDVTVNAQEDWLAQLN